jgi:hypothetical protein
MKNREEKIRIFRIYALFIGLTLNTTPVFAQATTDSLKAAGIPPSVENCAIYTQNADWLPEAYVQNARCACLTTPNEEKANIIRHYLQTELQGIADSTKQEMRQKKQLVAAKKLSRSKYNRFIRRYFTPLIYQQHVAAYQAATCAGDPAPYYAWELICTHSIKNCQTVWFSIKCLGGSCYNYFCKW